MLKCRVCIGYHASNLFLSFRMKTVKMIYIYKQIFYQYIPKVSYELTWKLFTLFSREILFFFAAHSLKYMYFFRNITYEKPLCCLLFRSVVINTNLL